MKRAVLTRGQSSDEGTFSTILFGGQTLRTVELPWRNNAPQRSCIPPGIYQAAIVQSQKFGRVYGLSNVPGRSHILIHAANFGGDVDKGWHSELLGCIAPVLSIGRLTPSKPGAKSQLAGLSSHKALSKLMAWAEGEPFELEIVTGSQLTKDKQ